MPFLSFISICLPPVFVLSLTQVVMEIRICNRFYQHEFLWDPGIKFPFVVLCCSRLHYFDYWLIIWHGRKISNDYIVILEDGRDSFIEFYHMQKIEMKMPWQFSYFEKHHIESFLYDMNKYSWGANGTKFFIKLFLRLAYTS